VRSFRRVDGWNETGWRSALGDYSRAADWLESFREQFKERHWQDIVANWVPILVPGYFGGLTHGLIRTAHAVRSFPEDANPSQLQIEELARGLAYWACTYRPLPGNPDGHGRFGVDEALRHLPRVDPGKQRDRPQRRSTTCPDSRPRSSASPLQPTPRRRSASIRQLSPGS